MKRIIYLDNAATTKADRRVVLEVEKFMTKNYGNASTLYSLGREAREAIENTRKKIAKFLNKMGVLSKDPVYAHILDKDEIVIEKNEFKDVWSKKQTVESEAQFR